MVISNRCDPEGRVALDRTEPFDLFVGSSKGCVFLGLPNGTLGNLPVRPLP
jgi:hypothetical protein